MKPVILQDETRRIGKPRNWDDEILGECKALSVYDHTDDNGLNWMISGWKPSEEELETLNSGGHVYIRIQGSEHPVIALTIV